MSSNYTDPKYTLWQLHGAYSAGKRDGQAHSNGGKRENLGVFYLAGSIQKHCWRHSIVDGLHTMLDAHPLEYPEWPIMERAIFGHFGYSGPYFFACDHGCYHGRRDHGMGVSTGGCGYDNLKLSKEDDRRQAVLSHCVQAIRNSDMVFAWIDKPAVYGTIFELGIALQAGKEIWLAGPHINSEHWLFRTAATLIDTDHPDSAADALKSLLLRRHAMMALSGQL